MPRQAGRDVMREVIGELIEECLCDLVKRQDDYLTNCIIELEADGWVSVKTKSGEIYNIKVSHATRK